ncbi:MAG: hypothetical protein ACOYD9_06265, partial [Pyramidobacter sp.]
TFKERCSALGNKMSRQGKELSAKTKAKLAEFQSRFLKDTDENAEAPAPQPAAAETAKPTEPTPPANAETAQPISEETLQGGISSEALSRALENDQGNIYTSENYIDEEKR